MSGDIICPHFFLVKIQTIIYNKIYYIVNNIVTHNDAIDKIIKIITDKIE